jgi:hypothetical protein
MLDADKVIQINNFIDRVHTPILWAFPVALGIFSALEIFLPTKQFFQNKFDAFYSWFKFDLVILASLVSASQGFSGGCLIQIPQNFLAQKYLGRDWLPYGLVFRENIDPSYWWLLRLVYFIGGVVALYTLYTYWDKRMKIPTNNTFLPKT